MVSAFEQPTNYPIIAYCELSSGFVTVSTPNNNIIKVGSAQGVVLLR